jgi:hypothetical protein
MNLLRPTSTSFVKYESDREPARAPAHHSGPIRLMKTSLATAYSANNGGVHSTSSYAPLASIPRLELVVAVGWAQLATFYRFAAVPLLE